ncbi:MAG: hypothetical protein IJA27_06665 [Lachnospiraceae bacterium]|nr:hypothetical protein [Lachnospiraceae bacterium]
MLEDKEAEMKLFLSNNYKDSAYKAYLEYAQLINDLKENGKIGEKDYEKLSLKVEDFKRLFKNYLR